MLLVNRNIKQKDGKGGRTDHNKSTVGVLEFLTHNEDYETTLRETCAVGDVELTRRASCRCFSKQKQVVQGQPSDRPSIRWRRRTK